MLTVSMTSGATALATAPAAAGWREAMPVFHVGLLGGENEADRRRNQECFRTATEERLGIPVELCRAPDYAGAIEGLLAGQLNYAALGPSAYAVIYLQDPGAVRVISSRPGPTARWTIKQ
ncbi:MAG: hypothetical protein ACXIU8_15515 [Alkalilacustris sp.]